MYRLMSMILLLAGVAVAQSLVGTNVRVTTHDIVTTDAYVAASGPADVLQQNEPSVAVHPAQASLIAVGMNDVRTLGISNDAWQTLAVSTDGGLTFPFEAFIPGFPTDTSAAGLASPVRGNAAAADPWLAFDNGDRLFYAFIAFQRTPPGPPDFSRRDTNVIAVARYNVVYSGGVPTGVSYDKTVVVERGTVGLGRQEDKEAMAVDTTGGTHDGNIYVCWARFTGFQSHLTVARSNDHGDSYSISGVGPAGNMQGCNLAVAPNGDVYVAWRTFDMNPSRNNPQDSAIFVARSTNGGTSFGRPVRVTAFVDYRQNATRTPPVFRTFSDAFLAADANGVYVAWQEKDPVSGSDIQISRSLDGGATWETPVMPHAAADHQLFPFISAANGKLSVAWYDSRNGPSFDPDGPVSGQCPAGAITGAACTGLDVYYNQTDTNTAAPLSFGTELRVTGQSFNPNLYGSIKAFTPFVGDYIGIAANAADAYVVWTDNRDMNPTANAAEDDDATTDPPALINARSRDSNIYIQKITK